MIEAQAFVTAGPLSAWDSGVYDICSFLFLLLTRHKAIGNLRTMKVYPNLDVDLTYQNFGSAWLGILRGATENIELAFNGLFNHCATNGEHQFQDHLQCVSSFWSDRRAMRRFFFNQYFMPKVVAERGNGKLARMAMRYAHTKLAELAATSHEFFMDFSKQYMLEPYSNGCITAERPDSDMKDAILANAFSDRDVSKVVDND